MSYLAYVASCADASLLPGLGSCPLDAEVVRDHPDGKEAVTTTSSEAALLTAQGLASDPDGDTPDVRNVSRLIQEPASVILSLHCSNLPNAAKWELEGLLRGWCQRHSRPATAAAAREGNDDQAPGIACSQDGRQPQLQPQRRLRQQRLWSGRLTLSRPLDMAGNSMAAGPLHGHLHPPPLLQQQPDKLPDEQHQGARDCQPPAEHLTQHQQDEEEEEEEQKDRGGLWDGQPVLSRRSPCGSWVQGNSAVLVGAWTWHSQLRTHPRPPPGADQGQTQGQQRYAGDGRATPTKTAANDAKDEECAKSSGGGGGADKAVAVHASEGIEDGAERERGIGCCAVGSDSEMTGHGRTQGTPTRKPRDATRRRLEKIQAAATAAEAITFNLSYERENNTPSYDRLRVAPLRLGSGLAASALPVSTALAAVPTLCAALNHESLLPSPPSQADGVAVGLPELLSVASDGAMAQRVGSGTASNGSEAMARPPKRRRVGVGDATDARGAESGGGGSFPSEFTFVLSRCWNCGSYGHDLRSCSRLRNQTAIDMRQRDFQESRAAVLSEQRRARQQQVAPPPPQRRGHRLRSSHGRYFSKALSDEEEAPHDTAAAAEAHDLGALPRTTCPPGVRPGVLSAALAAALALRCPLDPPPWLVSMALRGIPPSFCYSPYVPPPAPPQMEPPPKEAATGAAAATVAGADSGILARESQGIPLAVADGDGGSDESDGRGTFGSTWPARAPAGECAADASCDDVEGAAAAPGRGVGGNGLCGGDGPAGEARDGGLAACSAAVETAPGASCIASVLAALGDAWGVSHSGPQGTAGLLLSVGTDQDSCRRTGGEPQAAPTAPASAEGAQRCTSPPGQQQQEQQQEHGADEVGVGAVNGGSDATAGGTAGNVGTGDSTGGGAVGGCMFGARVSPVSSSSGSDMSTSDGGEDPDRAASPSPQPLGAPSAPQALSPLPPSMVPSPPPPLVPSPPQELMAQSLPLPLAPSPDIPPCPSLAVVGCTTAASWAVIGTNPSRQGAEIGAAAIGVAAAHGSAEDGDDADALLLRPLLLGVPCYVPYAGLNAPVPTTAEADAADPGCRERWQLAMSRGRQMMSLMAAVRGEARRRQVKRQEGRTVQRDDSGPRRKRARHASLRDDRNGCGGGLSCAAEGAGSMPRPEVQQQMQVPQQREAPQQHVQELPTQQGPGTKQESQVQQSWQGWPTGQQPQGWPEAQQTRRPEGGEDCHPQEGHVQQARPPPQQQQQELGAQQQPGQQALDPPSPQQQQHTQQEQLELLRRQQQHQMLEAQQQAGQQVLDPSPPPPLQQHTQQGQQLLLWRQQQQRMLEAQQQQKQQGQQMQTQQGNQHLIWQQQRQQQMLMMQQQQMWQAQQRMSLPRPFGAPSFWQGGPFFGGVG